MKRVACPKCGNYITFDERAYPTGRVLVFVCSACNKQFKVRVNSSAQDEGPTEPVYGYLTVIENAFHNKQIIALRMGENVVGRYVKGTAANAAIITTDPSIDTTHCIIRVMKNQRGEIKYVLRDAPSNTGTFLQDEILKDADRVNLQSGAIITIGATTIIFSTEKPKEAP